MKSSRVPRSAQWMSLVAMSMLLVVPSLAGQKPCSVTVTDLRCEYLKDPLGIDASQPRLSWKLAPVDPQARGQRHTAFQVLVASTQALLDKDQADLWDSGVPSLDQSVHVVYTGRPLGPGTECYWKVRVKDENGVTSAWSQAGAVDDGTAGSVRLDGQVDRHRRTLYSGKGLAAAGQQSARSLAAEDVRAQGQTRARHRLRGLGRLP